jgi:hypothetical protein
MIDPRAWTDRLTQDERRLFRDLDRPSKIQDFLETIPINFERDGDTCKSPRMVLETRTAQCIEGAMLAATALWFHGQRPLLLDLKATARDVDHVVAPYRAHGCWGAISKTNHAVLRYRDPVYRSVRELAMSYFHEYTIDNGLKTLTSYSAIFDLRRLGCDWIVSGDHLWDLSYALDRSRHYSILKGRPRRTLRRADVIERRAGTLVQWNRDARTRERDRSDRA